MEPDTKEWEIPLFCGKEGSKSVFEDFCASDGGFLEVLLKQGGKVDQTMLDGWLFVGYRLQVDPNDAYAIASKTKINRGFVLPDKGKTMGVYEQTIQQDKDSTIWTPELHLVKKSYVGRQGKIANTKDGLLLEYDGKVSEYLVPFASGDPSILFGREMVKKNTTAYLVLAAGRKTRPDVQERMKKVWGKG